MVMNKKIIIAIIFVLGIFASCTKDFEEINTDTKNPQVVTAEVLFTNAQIDLSGQISSTNVNLNIWKLMAQYWTERSYVDESNYDIVNRRIADNEFRIHYSILKGLSDAYSIVKNEVLSEPNLASKEVVRANKMAIIDLLEVYTYQRLVDMFGNVPYSEALDPENYTPVYDDAQTIYTNLISRAQASVAALDDSEESFGTADLIYKGDVASWIKFGNSLLVKLGIGIADGPLSALGQSTVEAASANVFTGLGDGAYFPYQSSLPYVNPLYLDLVASGRSDFLITTTIYYKMHDTIGMIEDPRIIQYFSNLTKPASVYGAKAGSYSGKMHYNSKIADPAFHGFFLTYDEVQFYLAEAAARGWNVGGSVESFYNEGVTSSILEWGGTETEASDFLAEKPITYYSSWQEAVATQAWIALYTRGFEGYTTYRRLDYPTFVMPPHPPTGVTVIPTRFTYPINEQTLNKDNYTAASTAMGGDLLTSKLFWDIH
jgi:hypothetical protein